MTATTMDVVDLREEEGVPILAGTQVELKFEGKVTLKQMPDGLVNIAVTSASGPFSASAFTEAQKLLLFSVTVRASYVDIPAPTLLALVQDKGTEVGTQCMVRGWVCHGFEVCAGSTRQRVVDTLKPYRAWRRVLRNLQRTWEAWCS